MRKVKKKVPELTAKQKVFVSAYLGESRFNATEAARIAGYGGDYATLRAIGSENLTKPNIASVIDERLKSFHMGASEVLARLSKHAHGSIADVLNENGDFDLAEAKRRGTDDLLKKLKVKRTIRRERGSDDEIEDVSYEYEIHDPQAALVHIGKHHKLFTEKHEHANPDGTSLLQPVADAMMKVYGSKSSG